MGADLERLKQHLPLLEYLHRHNWSGRRAGTQQEFVGLCPLHRAVQYLGRRGLHDSVLIEELGVGYARGGNLRRHLAALGYSLDQLLDVKGV